MPRYHSANNVDIEAGLLGAKDAASYAFGDSLIRAGFIRKVFGLLAVQLAITVAVGAAFVGDVGGVKTFAMQNPVVPFVCVISTLAIILYMGFNEKARSSYPQNLILLTCFTVCEGVIVGLATSRYQTDVILLALGITAAVTVSLVAYAITTKSDFTSMGSWLFAALLSLILSGFVGCILRTPIVNLAIAAGGAALFSLYIIYDVQILMGGQHQFKISPDEYIFATINIYLDIINLFLHILQILANKDR